MNIKQIIMIVMCAPAWIYAAAGENTMVVSATGPKKQIIAIGGKACVPPYTVVKYIVEQAQHAGIQRPKVSLLAQATGESAESKLPFYRAFSKVGAEASEVSLFGMVDPMKVAANLLTADIIYVGGGNTKSMLALWREWELDVVLKLAYNKGTILSGVSAGAICWFQQGITDSKIPLSTLPCMGILEGACCPHYDSEAERRPFYTQAVAAGTALPGIAFDDHTAGHYIDGELAHVLSWKPGQKVHKVTSDAHEELVVVQLLQ